MLFGVCTSENIDKAGREICNLWADENDNLSTNDGSDVVYGL